MRYPYAESIAEKIEAAIGVQLNDNAYDQVVEIVTEAAVSFAQEQAAELKNHLQTEFASVLRTA